MKSSWILFLLMSLFNKGYCSVEGNVANQSPSLLKSAIKSLAKWQIDNSLTNETFIAYNKINEGTLEIFGTAFGNEITKEMIDFFLQEIASKFYIHSVIFKWFYFDEKMLRIFDVFLKKLQKSVKSVTFERCYFPEAFVYKGSLELNCVTECSFIQCFSNEESLKEMFKVFKNSPVTSLTISRIFDYEQDESVDTNTVLQRFSYLGIKKRLMKINDLKLDSFFPNIKFLSLSHSSRDFDHLSLTSLKNLIYVDLCIRFENFSVHNILQCFDMNVKRIKISHSCDYCNPNFIENACDQKVIIDTDFLLEYNNILYAKALSVFSSLHFKMNRMNDRMAAIKDYVEMNGGVINTVTTVAFDMTFNHQNIQNIMTLLSYFPNLEDVEVKFTGCCDASIDDDQIHRLFSDLQLKSVKKLSINFSQIEETSAFYRFIVELMKLCQKMTSLKFHYFVWHSFAINIKEIVERENIQFSNLDTFAVDYKSDYMDVSIDLFYVAKYNIKNLTMKINNSIQNLDGLDQFECFPLDSLSITLEGWNFENFLNKFITKFPHVTNFDWNADPNYLISTNILQHMKKLKNVTVSGAFEMKDFDIFSSFLPFDLDSLEIKCCSNKIDEMKKVFYERFPFATFTLNVW